MKKIALTGGIASGKSLVGQYFTNRGEKVIDLDILNKQVLLLLRTQLIELFGADVWCDNQINTSYIKTQIFNDESLRQQLETLTHPKILKIMHQEIATLNTQRVIVMIPLLYESKWYQYFDYAILIRTTSELQLKRMLMRDDISPILATQILNAQTTDEKRMAICEHLPCTIVDNVGSITTLYQQLHTIL